MNSQTISIGDKRVKTFVTQKGDTLVIMNHQDARTLLEDVLHYEYSDSLLTVYKGRDSLNTNSIKIQKEVILKLSLSNDNFNMVIKNLNKIIANKDDEIVLKDETILNQKKEIKKQKFYKSVAVVGAIVLPILLLFLAN
tara:strand:+ start:45111 stop:45527 length:417 start_codon:yes stop_codon:yes gene_type:complete